MPPESLPLRSRDADVCPHPSLSKKIFDKLVDGEASSPATATLSSFCLNPSDSGRKNPPVPAVHAAGDDGCSRGLRPSRALQGFSTAWDADVCPHPLSLPAKGFAERIVRPCLHRTLSPHDGRLLQRRRNCYPSPFPAHPLKCGKSFAPPPVHPPGVRAYRRILAVLPIHRPVRNAFAPVADRDTQKPVRRKRRGFSLISSLVIPFRQARAAVIRSPLGRSTGGLGGLQPFR